MSVDDLKIVIGIVASGIIALYWLYVAARIGMSVVDTNKQDMVDAMYWAEQVESFKAENEGLEQRIKALEEVISNLVERREG